MPVDPFATSGGDFTEDYSGTISSFEWQQSEYGWQAVITNTLDTPTPKNDGTLRLEGKVFLRLPPKWEAHGETLVHESGDVDERVNGNSQVGRLISRVAEWPAAKDAILARGGPYVADAWVGLRFHWMTEGAGKAYKFKNEDGEEISGKSKGVTMPSEFLGTDGNPVAGTVGATTATAFDLDSLGLPDSVVGELATAAKSAETWNAFTSSALGVDGVTENATLVFALANQDLYQTLKNL